MLRRINFSSLFKNYLVYLSIFTVEIVALVIFIEWEVRKSFTESQHDVVRFLDVASGLIIFSVILMAVLVHILMKKRISETSRLVHLESVTKKSEQTLLNEAKYRSLFENNGTAILVVGDNEFISDCNAKFEQLIGYSKIEMVNQLHWKKIVHTDDIERIHGYDKLRRDNPEKAPTEYLMKLKRKDGSLRQVMVTVIVLQGTEQLASIVDITEIAEIDRKLKENQELLSQAQEIASMGSWSYFFESGSINVSDQFLSILDIKDTRESISMEFLRKNLRFEQFFRIVTDMINSLKPADTEITYLKTNQTGTSETMYFKLKGRIVSEAGKPVKIIGILQDITDRKRIENEINRTNKDMKNLLYVASHDLQIPLISIEGFAALLINSVRENELTPESVSYLERIVSNTKLMSSLFKNFFEMSKNSEKRHTFEKFSTSDLISKVTADNKILIEKFGSKISVAQAGDLPDVFGDKENIRLLFHNLIINAVLYGGKNIFIGYEDNKGFYVKDDGRGVNPSDTETMFLPGERLEEKIIPGAGMGLTFCRKVADIHSGKIWAESEGMNKGTVIYFMPSYELIRD